MSRGARADINGGRLFYEPFWPGWHIRLLRKDCVEIAGLIHNYVKSLGRA